MTTNSHRHCDHDATKAARTACRKLRAQGIDTTLGLADLVANRLHRANADHTRTCCWHVAMSLIENHDLDHDEDLSPEALLELAQEHLTNLCQCD